MNSWYFSQTQQFCLASVGVNTTFCFRSCGFKALEFRFEFDDCLLRTICLHPHKSAYIHQEWAMVSWMLQKKRERASSMFPTVTDFIVKILQSGTQSNSLQNTFLVHISFTLVFQCLLERAEAFLSLWLKQTRTKPTNKTNKRQNAMGF